MATDIEELRQMVCTFRVSELQVLLGFAGRNKSGRKQELMSRAMQLIHRVCPVPIQIKIKELHRRRFPTKQSTASAMPDVKTPPRPTNSSVIPTSSAIHSTELDNSLGRILDGPVDFSKNRLHSSLPVHPDVRFKTLPFYDILGELIKPTSLVPRGTTRYQETFYMFHLTPQQAQDIAMSREIHSGARVDYSVQVQLRFCLLETSCDQADNFPQSICVRVNGKIAQLPPPIPTNKPGVEPKRPSRPVNITNLCRINPTTPNHISISWATELARGFCVSINLVRKLSSDTLLQRLRFRGIRHADHSRAMIKEKLQHDPGSEIATTSLRVSLMCPLGKMRLSIPARSMTCTHLQCFDVSTYLMMNERKPTWICPICDKSAPYDQINIDGLFVEILELCSSKEIQFGEDGSWSALDEDRKKKPQVIDSPRVPDNSSASDNQETIVVAEEKKKKEVVIDLTLSSSEDEDSDTDNGNDNSMDRTLSPSPPPKSTCSSAQSSPIQSVSPGIVIKKAKIEPGSKTDYLAPSLSRLIEEGIDDPPGWPTQRPLTSTSIPSLAHMTPQNMLARYNAPTLPDLDVFNLDFESSRDDMFRNFLEPSNSSNSRNNTNSRSTSYPTTAPFSFSSSSTSTLPTVSHHYNLWRHGDDSSGSDVIPLD